MNAAVDQCKQKKRLFRRGPSETTWPKEKLVEFAPTEWAEPWTRVVEIQTTGFFLTGACYRGGVHRRNTPKDRYVYAVVYPHPRGWYYFAGDAEGVTDDREYAKYLCDVELTRKRIALRVAPQGCTIETDEGPQVTYEEG